MPFPDKKNATFWVMVMVVGTYGKA